MVCVNKLLLLHNIALVVAGAVVLVSASPEPALGVAVVASGANNLLMRGEERRHEGGGNGKRQEERTGDTTLNRYYYDLHDPLESEGSLDQLLASEHLTVVNLDTAADEDIAADVETGVQEEFDDVDRLLGESLANSTTPLPEHRANRQMSLIYQGVYVPDARFNAFVDGVMVNMMAEVRRRRMDPLYFRVHKGGSVQHVPTRRRSGKGNTTQKPERQAIGGGVIRGLTKIKRFGNAEVQVAGNATLVRSHHVFGPLDFEFAFDTTNGVRKFNSTLTSLAAHGLAKVTPQTASFLDFIIDSPSDYEIQLRGTVRNKRLLRLSKAAILRLVRREGRLETRLMRMFARAGQRPLPQLADGNNGEGLWPTKVPKAKESKKETSTVVTDGGL